MEVSYVLETTKSKLFSQVYSCPIFLQMITDNGGRATAKTLINAIKPSDGYTALWHGQRLDLTVEAEVVEHSRWHSLFTAEELDRAKKRLIAYDLSAEKLKLGHYRPYRPVCGVALVPRQRA